MPGFVGSVLYQYYTGITKMVHCIYYTQGHVLLNHLCFNFSDFQTMHFTAITVYICGSQEVASRQNKNYTNDKLCDNSLKLGFSLQHTYGYVRSIIHNKDKVHIRMQCTYVHTYPFSLCLKQFEQNGHTKTPNAQRL